VFYAAIYASGDSKTPLKIGILTNLINAVLDYILIFGKFGFPELGVKGAATATLIAYTLDLFLFMYVFLSGKTSVSMKKNFELSYVRRALRVGIPTGVERLITFSSFIAFVRIISEYGTYTLAGYQVGLRVEGLAFMPGFGFTTAAMALVGQSLAALYIRVVGFSQIPLAYAFVLTGALRGAGATKLSLFVNATSQWLFRIAPSIIAMKISKNVLWVYVIMNIETFITALWLWYIFKRGKWKYIKV